MKMLFILLSIIIILPTLANTYFIGPVEISDKSDKNSATVVKELITSAIYEYGQDFSATPDSSAYKLQAKLLKLSSHYLITITEFTNDGLMTNNKKAKINSLDQIDAVIDQLCKEIFSASKNIKSVKVSTSEERTKKAPKMEREVEIQDFSDKPKNSSQNFALTFQNFSFGPAQFTGFDNSEMAYHLSYGRFWEVHPNAAIKATGAATANYNQKLSMFLAAALGINYYIFTGPFSPYLGADFGFGLASIDTAELEAKFGFSYGLSIGALLFRTSSVQIGVDLTHRSLLPKMNGEHPRATALTLGINL